MEISYWYENWSSEVFPGFYYSSISPDTELDFMNEDEDLKENQRYEIPYEQYQRCLKDITGRWLEAMNKELSDDDDVHMEMVIEGFGLNQPREYNFTTDKFQCYVKFDVDALLKWVLKDNRDKFKKYLEENWKSRDGFISYIEWNIEKFEEIILKQYQEGMDWKDGYMDVLIEFYLLNTINFYDVETDVIENLYEIVIGYAELKED